MWLKGGEEGMLKAYCVGEMVNGFVMTGREGRMTPKGGT